MRLDLLLCSERSGSNLITQMLGAHPALCGPPPTHLIRTLALNVGRYGDLDEDQEWRMLCGDADALLAAGLGDLADPPSLDELLGSEPRTFGGLIRAVYAREVAVAGASSCFVKENRAWCYSDFLHVTLPDARYVWLVRDPRDMALSWKRSPNHPGGVARAAEVWVEDQEGFLAMHRALVTSGRSSFMRYEDLISDPEPVLGGVLAILGQTWDPACLAFHEDEKVKGNASRLRNWENLARPVMGANSGKFEGALSDSEIRYLELVCGPLMEQLGYEPSRESTGASREELLARITVESPDAETLEPRTGEVAIRERRRAALDRILARPMRPLG